MIEVKLRQLLKENRVICVEDSHVDYMGSHPHTLLGEQLKEDQDKILFYVPAEIKTPLEIFISEQSTNQIYSKIPVLRLVCHAEIKRRMDYEFIVQTENNRYQFWNVQRPETQKHFFGKDTPKFEIPRMERCGVQWERKDKGFQPYSYIVYSLGGE